MPFNLGPAELIIILAIALIVFGPKKLPEIGRGIGQAMREFNKARNDFMDSLHTEMDTEPSRSSSYDSPAYASRSAGEEYDADRRIEYPAPLEEDDSDALPYGGEYVPGGDSQPVLRTAHALEPEHSGERLPV